MQNTTENMKSEFINVEHEKADVQSMSKRMARFADALGEVQNVKEENE